ncbi:hypothetical protein HG530_011903 [Fusarium avenaceum]|nr:hypothetical protein DER45DRAFT_608836 [Fusarium avenaceum]KAI6756167.1 hypothetical protein HG530_011903 [Fusarium avenaceum]KIL90027.1 hypothetical protein FAVG1_06765 [Fusarium avenaceum]
MDFIKKAVSGGSSDASKTGGSTSTTNNNQDYGDKAASFLNDKAGLNISKDNQEKATDFARSQYEKSSGTKIDPKYSN